MDDNPETWFQSIDAVKVCDVPPALGHVTALKVKNGRLIAETASGTPMIVPAAISPDDVEGTK